MKILLSILTLFVLFFAFCQASGGIEEFLPWRHDSRNHSHANSCPTPTVYGETVTVSISVDGKTRYYDLYVPKSIENEPQVPRSLLLNFHGYGGNAAEQARRSHMIVYAEKEKFIAVHPHGSGIVKGWSAGICCPVVPASDDLKFTREIVQKVITQQACVDPKRIFATGFSNGGFMSHYIACELSDIFRAVAPHSGLLGPDSLSTCKPKRTIPVVSFHGTADPTVPYFGTNNWASFTDTLELWRVINQCGPQDTAEEEGPQIEWYCIKFNNCGPQQNLPISFCTIQDMAHKWAGGTDYPDSDIHATDYMWKFFNSLP